MPLPTDSPGPVYSARVTTDEDGAPLAVEHYRVYRDDGRHHVAGNRVLVDSTTDLTHLDDAAGYLKDPLVNCYYSVVAMAGGKESDPSNEVGEFDIMVQWEE